MKDTSKLMIILSICMIIFESIIAIASKDITYFVIALMWGLVAIIQYTNTKIIEMKDKEIEINKEIIKCQSRIMISQSDAINDFLEERENDSTADGKR